MLYPIQSAQSAPSTPPQLDIASTDPNFREKKVLNILSSVCMGNIVELSYEPDSVLKQDELNEILGCIAVQLIEDAETPIIEFEAAGIVFKLEEQEYPTKRVVDVSAGKMEVEIPIVLEDIKFNVMHHILTQFGDVYLGDLEKILNELLSKSDLYGALSRRAAEVVLETRAFHFNENFLFPTADLILNNQVSFTWEKPKKIMELIICRTITKASTMDQAVKDILNNPNSPKTVIRCAATYTMQCLLGRSYDAFILAAGYFFEHAKFCEKDSLIQIAITFIDYNEDFFNKSITDQEDFSTFYKEMGHFKAIKRYSSELHETFRLSDDILPVTAKHNDNTPKIQHRARSFWYAGAFEKAMEINLELALFVLRHRNHPAILLFRLINNTGLGELDGA